MSVLDVAHLSHSYGGREIFDDVSFRLEKGEHVALVGANGEGKSTFMSIITGKLTPDEGKVTWVRLGAREDHPGNPPHRLPGPGGTGTGNAGGL